MDAPLRRIRARAPLRINDIGGWTDTWFASRGRVLNLAVSPGVEVEVTVVANPERIRERVSLRSAGLGATPAFAPEEPGPVSGPLALARHAVAALRTPEDVRLEIRLSSSVPPGFGTGTSSSVCVALLGALDRLSGGGSTPDELAALAHRIETERLGRQSGVQDQIAAARGGVSFIRMTAYPRSEVETLPLGKAAREALDRRLLVVGLGEGHDSSALHERVIAELEKGGRQTDLLERMARLAEEARDRLAAGDLDAYGGLMVENNECQRALAAGLVPPEADAVIRAARAFGASGWKVNGAGGKGGSMTLLAGQEPASARALTEAIDALGGGIRTFRVRMSPGGVRSQEIKSNVES